MKELSMVKKARIVVEILAKYPGEFEPHEHQFVAEAENSFDVSGSDEELNHVLVSFALWKRVERLWSHEQGMLTS